MTEQGALLGRSPTGTRVAAGGGLLRRLCYRNYRTAKLYEQWSARERLRDRNPILVYQMGKVGSMAIRDSLRAALPGREVFHLHFLDGETLRREDAFFRSIFPELGAVPGFIQDGELVRHALDRGMLDRPVKVVTLVRDPVARAVSAFFWGLHTRSLEHGLRRKVRAMPPEELAREVEPLFRAQEGDRYLNRHEYWFEEELERVFGVDVYAEPFSKERGYHIYQGERAEVLLLNLEALDRCAEGAFSRFLGLERFEMHSCNEAASRRYYPAYRAFIKQMEFSREYLERCYGSRMARHFYTPQELSSLRGRWRST